MLSGRLGVLAVLTAALAAPKASDQSFQIVLDHSGAPQMAEYAERAKALAEEWYPKIDVILFGPNHAFIHRKITIVIEPSAPKQVQLKGRSGSVVASSSNGVIRLHTEWLAKKPADFDQVIVHELTHVNEDNHALHIKRCDGIHLVPCLIQMHLSRPNRGMEWLTESICDYVAYAVFSRKLAPRLRLDTAGRLTGYDDSAPYLYGLERARIPVSKRGYRHSYTVGASFLLWLAETKDSDIVRKLNVAMTAVRCSPQLLQQYTGTSLDQLWREFTRQ